MAKILVTGSKSGKYICWLSADDMFLPDKVAKQVAQMEADQNLFCYTSFMVIDAFERKQYEIHPPCFKDQRAIVIKLLEGCFINGSSVMMRKSALQKVGGFDEKLPRTHDYDLWLRFFTQLYMRISRRYSPGISLAWQKQNQIRLMRYTATSGYLSNATTHFKALDKILNYFIIKSL